MKSDKLTRRQVLGATVLGLPAIPVVVETAFAQAKPAAGALPVLSPTEPAAKALGYIEDATKVDAKKFATYAAGRNCANCNLFQAKAGDAWGACAAVGGKQVNAKGWCVAWVKKA